MNYYVSCPNPTIFIEIHPRSTKMGTVWCSRRDLGGSQVIENFFFEFLYEMGDSGDHFGAV